MTKQEIIAYIADEMVLYYGAILDKEKLKSICALAELDEVAYACMGEWERSTDDIEKDALLFEMEERLNEASRNDKIFYDFH